VWSLSGDEVCDSHRRLDHPSGADVECPRPQLPQRVAGRAPARAQDRGASIERPALVQTRLGCARARPPPRSLVDRISPLEGGHPKSSLVPVARSRRSLGGKLHEPKFLELSVVSAQNTAHDDLQSRVLYAAPRQLVGYARGSPCASVARQNPRPPRIPPTKSTDRTSPTRAPVSSSIPDTPLPTTIAMRNEDIFGPIADILDVDL